MPSPTVQTVPLVIGEADVVRCRVHVGVETRPLRPKEAALLAYLAARPEVTVSRDELLREVWGYAPTARSRTLDVTVRRLRACVEPDPDHPIHVLTVPGEGYRFAPPAWGAPARAALAADRPSEPADRFVGREDELAILADDLAVARVVTLLGPGGMGKTRLALRHVALRGHTWPGGVVRVDLSAARASGDVLAVVARETGVPVAELPDAVAPERVGAALRRRGRVLVLLDGAEGDPAGVAALVTRWASAAPEARFLVTSREPLRVAGERLRAIGPLPTGDGVRLFLDRARARSPGFEAADDTLVAIIESLGGIPLGIELAAARALALDADELVRALRTSLAPLSDRRRDLPDRQRSLEAVLAWSWARLDPVARRALARATRFAAPFTLEALDAIADADRPAWSIVEELLELALIARRADGFALLDPVRLFAAQRLGDQEARHATERHADWALDRATRLRATLHGPDGLDARRDLVALVPELLAIVERAGDDDPDRAVAAALAAAPVLVDHASAGPRQALLDATVRRADGRDPRSAAWARVWRARDPAARDQARAEEDLRIASEVGERLGDDVLAREARLQRAILRHHFGAVRDAEPALVASIAEHAAAGDRVREALATSALAAVRMHAGDLVAARDAAERAVALARLSDDRYAEARYLGVLGVIHLVAGRHEAAAAALDEVLGSRVATGDVRFEATHRMNRAILDAALGRPEAAIAGYERAIALYRSAGIRRNEAYALTNQAHALLAVGAHDRARAVLATAEALCRDEQDEIGALLVEGQLGLLAVLEGAPERARSTLSSACARLDALGQRRLAAWDRTWLAVAFAELGQPEQAATAFAQARAEAPEDLALARVHAILRPVVTPGAPCPAPDADGPFRDAISARMAAAHVAARLAERSSR